MPLTIAHVLFSWVLACVAFPPVASTQLPGGANEYAIAGSVRREDTNEALGDVRMELLTSVGSTAHPSILSARSGEFSFGEFAAGRYEIVAQLDGYLMTRLPVEISRFDQTNLVVRMRKQFTSADPGGDSITAHQLGVPQKARAAFEKGVAKADSHRDSKGAILDFQRAITIYPDYYEAYAEMGTAYVRLKDFSAAEKALRQSIEISAQKYVPPIMLLSMLLNDQNRAAEAEPLARQVIAADANAWRGPYELARAQLALRRLPEAEASAYAARNLKPENPDIYLLLSEIHRHTQNPKALLEDIDTYLKLAPQGPAAPQIRKLREQLLKFMESQSKPPAASGQRQK